MDAPSATASSLPMPSDVAVRAELGCPYPDPIAAVASAQVEAVVDTVLAKLPIEP